MTASPSLDLTVRISPVVMITRSGAEVLILEGAGSGDFEGIVEQLVARERGLT